MRAIKYGAIAAGLVAAGGITLAACGGSSSPSQGGGSNNGGNSSSGNSNTSQSVTAWYNSYRSGTVVEFTQPASDGAPLSPLALPGGFAPTSQLGQPDDVGSLVCAVSFDGGTTQWHVFTDSDYGNYVSPTATALCSQLASEQGATVTGGGG